MNTPELQIEEVGKPINFKWNKCKLETVSFGHGITTTPLQATAVYAALSNGGTMIKTNLIKKENYKKNDRLISKETSKQLNNILRKVVTDEEGTAGLADINGYYVGGKLYITKYGDEFI